MNKLSTALLSAIFALAFTTSASATLTGLTIDIESGDTPGGGCAGVVVGGGVECTIYDSAAETDDYIGVDVGAESVTFNFFAQIGTWDWSEPSNTDFEILVTGLDWGIGALITGIDPVWTPNLPGVQDGTNPSVSFDDTELSLFVPADTVWEDCSGVLCAQLVVGITADHPQGIPEPTSLALLGLGLAGLGARRKIK